MHEVGFMPQISAADNQLIDLSDNAWHIRPLGEQEPPTVSATADGLQYTTGYALSRRLPADGLLTHDQMEEIILGWQKSDETWHLGILLADELARKRGSRWLELARWPDPEHDVFTDLAREAGSSIAQVLGVPFNFIEPEPVVLQQPSRDLPPLPLNLGMWLCVGPGSYEGQEIAEGQVAFVRSALWRRHKRRRILTYLLYALLYTLASGMTLLSPLGLPNAGTLLPNPHLLPYFGLLTAAGLAAMALYHAVTSLQDIRVVRFSASGITAYNPSGERWSLPATEIGSVYVSEVLKKGGQLVTDHGEINLHLGGGKFRYLLQQEAALATEAHLLPNDWERPREEGVRPLTRADYFTDLQAAALYAAEVLAVPAWLDVRPQRHGFWHFLVS
jgi:hypothetical protein